MDQLRIWLAYFIMPKDTRKYLIKAISYNIEELEREITQLFDQMNVDISPLNDKKKLSWLGKNCKDCGNEKCKKLGTLPKGYSCALWQAESEAKE